MKNLRKYVKESRIILLGIIFVIIGTNYNPVSLFSIGLVILGLWLIVYNIVSKVEKSLNIN